jgi:hypothetical protein
VEDRHVLNVLFRQRKRRVFNHKRERRLLVPEPRRGRKPALDGDVLQRPVEVHERWLPVLQHNQSGNRDRPLVLGCRSGGQQILGGRYVLEHRRVLENQLIIIRCVAEHRLFLSRQCVLDGGASHVVPLRNRQVLEDRLVRLVADD